MMQVIWKGPFDLTVQGHAGWADPGSDIVCAAGSMLVYALAETLRKEPDIAWEIRMASGYAGITAVPEKEAYARCRGAFEVARTGFRLLAEGYPKNVQVTDEASEI